MNIKIIKPEHITKSNQNRLNKLIKELDPNFNHQHHNFSNNFLKNPHTFLFLAVDEHENALGMITLSTYPQIVGEKKAHIEDFIVNESIRGKGIGKKLFQKAISEAKQNNCTIIEFTSNPKRIAANKLYQSEGFSIRETNCYSKKI